MGYRRQCPFGKANHRDNGTQLRKIHRVELGKLFLITLRFWGKVSGGNHGVSADCQLMQQLDAVAFLRKLRHVF